MTRRISARRPSSERAEPARDAEALRTAAVADAVLRETASVHPRSGVPLRARLSTVLPGGARIGRSRTQVATDRATWTLRLPEGLGPAEADFTDGRVSGLRLGPVR